MKIEGKDVLEVDENILYLTQYGSLDVCCVGANLDTFKKQDIQKLIDALQVYHNNRKG